MREIKFRAWSKDLNKMFKVGQVTLEKGGWNYEPDDREYKGVCVPYQPSWVLMQFTGLYDKNKVPIYEGDIIRDNTLVKDVNTMIVIYENGGFFVDYSEEYKPLLAGVNHNCEVIGNVWEKSDMR